MKRSSLLIALLLAVPPFLSAQEQAPADRPLTRFGILGGINLALHTADFRALPGYPSCCPEYSSGFGLNPSVEGVYDLPLSSSLSLSLRAGFDAWGADLRQTEETTVEQNGVATPMTIDHTIRSNISTVGVGAYLAYPAGDRLRLLGGVKTGFVLGADFTGDERIADESIAGTFENGERVRHEYVGDIPGSSPLLAGVSLGTSYDLPLNGDETWLAVPEITATFGLLPVSSDVTWSAHSLRIGVALMHAPRHEPEAPEPPLIAEPSTPPAPVPPLAGTVAASGIGNDGVSQGNVTLQVEEFVATDIRPVLGYVFFEEGESALPQRYGKISPSRRETFDPNELNAGTDPLVVQLRSLDIIGYRMQQNSDARLVLTGTNDGSPNENTELSSARAEEVREYLTERWGIDPARITTEARDLPATPSNMDVADGQAENRRVEIRSNSREILSPVRMADTLRHASPPTIRFTPEITSGEVASWEITASQNGTLLKRIEGEGTPPEYIDWTIDLEEETIPKAPGTITVAMKLTGKNGESFTTGASAISVEQVTLSRKQRETVGGVEIERYSLILFDFDRADLRPEHREMIALVRAGLTPESVVTVRGFTDRIGDPTRNRELALERATNVARELGLPASRTTVEAGGTPPYDNDTPDGRFYSRTVQIEVRHPLSSTDVE